jgi:hypothetical protein
VTCCSTKTSCGYTRNSGKGDLAGARPLFERALAIDEKALGHEHPEVATNLANLANLLQA